MSPFARKARRGARLLSLGLILLWPGCLWADAPARVAADAPHIATGSLDGTLTDADGQPVGGVEVKLSDARGQLVARTLTDRQGRFRFDALAPGRYTATASGLGASLALNVSAGQAATVKLAAVQELHPVTVIGTRVQRARNALSPATGSSQYAFDRQAIEALPQGEATPLNEVLLQAPGVANDSYGQLHVRGDHADLQYRINGVILPEGVSGFAQTLDTRLAQKIELLTGALPAQYGERTAGVVDLTTKDDLSGGVVDFYGGSHATLNPSLQLGKTAGRFTGYFAGSYLSSTLGVENPTPDHNAIHDRTAQGKGFGYVSWLLGENLKLVTLFGTALSRFEIPNNPYQTPDPAYLNPLGLSGFDSARLNERQFERNQYGILALQGVGAEDVHYQLAAFERASSVDYQPDPLGDLAFNGVAAAIKRKSSTLGLQGDLSIPLGTQHTLRAGVLASTEDDRADNTSRVFTTVPPQSDGSCPSGSQANGDGSYCVSGGPVTIVDNNPKNGNTLLALYVQDQWDVSDALTLNYGLRYDRLNAFVTASQLSPRVGAIWYATRSTTFHAGYARYFTPPANELISNASLAKFANTTNAPQITDNSPVQPERSHYFDLGVLQQFGPWLSVGLDGYYKYVRDLQDEGQFGQALIFAPFNYQQGHIYGLELSTVFHCGPWNAYFNLAHSTAQATRVVSGQFHFGPDELAYIDRHYVYLDHDQRLTASAGLSYRWRGTTFSADATYGSGLRKDFANTGKLPPNFQLDLGAMRPVHLPAFGKLDLRLAALNVLDRKNIIRDGSGIGVGAPQYGPRAALYFGVSKPFGL
jgi:outer membrane receptor protein involved in Fe transport